MPKGNEGFKDYVKENVVDDVEDVYQIIDIAKERMKDSFDISGSGPNDTTIDDELITIFCKTYETIVSHIYRHILDRNKNNDDTGFEIDVARRFVIGYDNALNEDYEKNGGFMIYVKHLYYNSTGEIDREYEDSTIELCAKWNSANILKNPEFIKKCAEDTVKVLNAFDIAVESSETIMPIFIYIYDALTQYIVTKRAETKEFRYSINFCSMFDISALEGDENNVSDVITIQPAIWSKLALKSDALASNKYDE